MKIMYLAEQIKAFIRQSSESDMPLIIKGHLSQALKASGKQEFTEAELDEFFGEKLNYLKKKFLASCKEAPQTPEN